MLITSAVFTPIAANAEVCDYRLSSLIGGSVATAGAVTAASTATVGATMNVLGYYTLTHAITGATMLGSTMVGSSAAGTVGIIGGTGAGIGAAGAAVMNPIGIAVGVVLAVAVGGSETYCFFQDERIAEYDEILFIMKGLDANADPNSFELREPSDPTIKKASILITDKEGVTTQYWVKNLYIVNGVLKYRDFGPNTTIGEVGLQVNNPSAQPEK
jgi:hypothetical protein